MKISQSPSNKAIQARINRKLVRRDLVLRKCPDSSRDFFNLGDYYLIDPQMNLVYKNHVDLFSLAAKEGCLPFRNNAETRVSVPRLVSPIYSTVDRSTVDRALLNSHKWSITTQTTNGSQHTSLVDPDCLHREVPEIRIGVYFDSFTHDLLPRGAESDEVDETLAICGSDSERYWEIPDSSICDSRDEALTFVQGLVDNDKSKLLMESLRGPSAMRRFRYAAQTCDLHYAWQGYRWVSGTICLINFFRSHFVNPIPI